MATARIGLPGRRLSILVMGEGNDAKEGGLAWATFKIRRGGAGVNSGRDLVASRNLVGFDGGD